MRVIYRSLAALFGAIVLSFAMSAAETRAGSDNPIVVAHEMVNAWNALDADAIAELFAEDGRFQSMMAEPIVGREVLREHFGTLLAGATALELQLRNVAVSGNAVFIERVDVFTYQGKTGSVPVVCVMEISDGKVQEWREYYDRAELLSEMGISEGEH
jgi:limonene-1,2-epoxide hydrolase